MAEYLDLEGLKHFKQKQDSANEDKFLKKTDFETTINDKLTSVYKYKGTVEEFDNLPTEGNAVGDVYDVANGMNYAWNGDEWDALGETRIEVDSELNGSSTAAIQNKAVYDALQKKADKADSYPTTWDEVNDKPFDSISDIFTTGDNVLDIPDFINNYNSDTSTYGKGLVPAGGSSAAKDLGFLSGRGWVEDPSYIVHLFQTTSSKSSQVKNVSAIEENRFRYPDSKTKISTYHGIYVSFYDGHSAESLSIQLTDAAGISKEYPVYKDYGSETAVTEIREGAVLHLVCGAGKSPYWFVANAYDTPEEFFKRVPVYNDGLRKGDSVGPTTVNKDIELTGLVNYGGGRQYDLYRLPLNTLIFGNRNNPSGIGFVPENSSEDKADQFLAGDGTWKEIETQDVELVSSENDGIVPKWTLPGQVYTAQYGWQDNPMYVSYPFMCTTAGGVADKIGGSALGMTGPTRNLSYIHILIFFRHDNTASNPTLDITCANQEHIKGAIVDKYKVGSENSVNPYTNLKAYKLYHMYYDGTNWMVLNPETDIVSTENDGILPKIPTDRSSSITDVFIPCVNPDDNEPSWNSLLPTIRHKFSTSAEGRGILDDDYIYVDQVKLDEVKTSITPYFKMSAKSLDFGLTNDLKRGFVPKLTISSDVGAPGYIFTGAGWKKGADVPVAELSVLPSDTNIHMLVTAYGTIQKVKIPNAVYGNNGNTNNPGLVPANKNDDKANQFLAGDGTWKEIDTQDINVDIVSTDNAGIVPKLPEDDSIKVLASDGTWKMLGHVVENDPNAGTNHPGGAFLMSGGTHGVISVNGADYQYNGGAPAFVPQSKSVVGQENRFLREDGQWTEINAQDTSNLVTKNDLEEFREEIIESIKSELLNDYVRKDEMVALGAEEITDLFEEIQNNG